MIEQSRSQQTEREANSLCQDIVNSSCSSAPHAPESFDRSLYCSGPIFAIKYVVAGFTPAFTMGQVRHFSSSAKTRENGRYSFFFSSRNSQARARLQSRRMVATDTLSASALSSKL